MTGSRLVVGLLLLAGIGAGIWWLGSSDGARLFAVSPTDGRVRWSAALPAGVRVVGSPVSQGGRVVVTTAGAEPMIGGVDRWHLTAFDASSGWQLWQHQLPREERRRSEAITIALTVPYLTADHAFIREESSDGARLVAVHAATGQVAWTFDDVGYGHSSRHTDIAAQSGRVFASTQDEATLTIWALDERDGSRLWSVPLTPMGLPRNDLGPFFAATAETLYVGTNQGVVALDAATGAERYRIDDPADESGGQIALAEGTLYRRTGLQTVAAFDPATGQERWTYRHPFGDQGGALRGFSVRDGLLVVYCACDEQGRARSGWLLAVDTADGHERWRSPVAAYRSFVDLGQVAKS